MKLNLTFAALLLFMTSSGYATEYQTELFLYSLQDPSQEAPQALLEEPKVASPKHQTTINLDYDEPCGIKCGVSNTGLFLLHMIAESKADQEYRNRLINPNYEP